MIFDAHSDLWGDVTARREAGERDVLARRHLPAMAEGGVEGSVFVLWADPIGGMDYVTATSRLLAGAKAELAGCGQVRLVRTWAELEDAHRQGKFYIVLGVEGMAAIGDRPSGVDWYYAHGVRWGMLTWNEENALATGAGGPAGSGLTAAGRQAVRRMEELGMVVDVSHLNDGGFRDVAALAQGIVVASHSNCRRLCDVPRNLTDDQLRAIRDSGGVIGVNAYHGFVHKERQHQNVEMLARHAAHIIAVCRVEHLGCGFDFCQYLGPGNDPIPDMTGPAQAPRLLDALRRMGLREDAVALVARDNWLRVLRTVLGGNNAVVQNRI